MTDEELGEVEKAARGWSASTFSYVEADDFPGCGWGAVVIAPIEDEEPTELDTIDEHVALPIVTMLNACPGLVAEVRRLMAQRVRDLLLIALRDTQLAQLHELLAEAGLAIRGLADQQAMADDHYQPVLDRIDAALRGDP